MKSVDKQYKRFKCGDYVSYYGTTYKVKSSCFKSGDIETLKLKEVGRNNLVYNVRARDVVRLKPCELYDGTLCNRGALECNDTVNGCSHCVVVTKGMSG